MADNNITTGQIFTNAYKTVQNFTAQGAVLAYKVGDANSKLIPLLLFDISINFGRQIQPRYPLNVAPNGSLMQVNMMGAPSGVLECQGIIAGNVDDLIYFLQKTGEACATNAVSGVFSPYTDKSCPDQQLKYKYSITNMMLESTGIRVQGDGIGLVNQPVRIQFSNLELLKGADTTGINVSGATNTTTTPIVTT